MDEMIERVARAICDSLEADIYDDLSEGSIVKAAYRQQASAAIAAMRERPSRDMILAGYKALMDWDARTGDDYGMFEIWQAMISAALATPPAEG